MYERELAKYLEKLSDSEKHKTKRAVNIIVAILEANGRNWPENNDIEEYRKENGATDKSKNKKTTTQNISRINKFFDWLREEKKHMEEMKGTLDMLPEAQEAQLEAVEADEPEALPEKVETSGEEAPLETENPSKVGRKRLDTENGEIRNKKLTVYLTDTQLANFKALCLLKHINSESDFALSLIIAEINKNEKALSFFRQAEKMIE